MRPWSSLPGLSPPGHGTSDCVMARVDARLSSLQWLALGVMTALSFPRVAQASSAVSHKVPLIGFH